VAAAAAGGAVGDGLNVVEGLLNAAQSAAALHSSLNIEQGNLHAVADHTILHFVCLLDTCIFVVYNINEKPPNETPGGDFLEIMPR
jgi:hypothetical protein